MAKKSKHLVVVESPAKAKTINQYLGDEYIVKASLGHVRDLPKTSMGVKINGGFQPNYRVMPERKKTVDELRKAARGADKVYFATDLDREGEAIAWHLAQAIEVPDGAVYRVIRHLDGLRVISLKMTRYTESSRTSIAWHKCQAMASPSRSRSVAK